MSRLCSPAHGRDHAGFRLPITVTLVDTQGYAVTVQFHDADLEAWEASLQIGDALVIFAASVVPVNFGELRGSGTN